jgi:hypothetical protein
MGFVPLGNPKGDRADPCRLCGSVGDLTRPHAPSRASGNRGHARPLGEKIASDGTRILELGKGTADSGGWGWYFCTACNGETGRWEEEHLRWQRPILGRIHEHGSPRPLPPGEMPDRDPGAFVRALWAWMFALDETLFDGHRDLAAAVRSGDAVEPPRDLRLWLAATTSLEMRASRMRDGYVVTMDVRNGPWRQRESGLWSLEPELVELPRAVISTPPFIVVLADSAHEAPLFDTAPWLAETAGNRRAVPLLVPTVEVRRRPDHVVRYDDIAVLQLHPVRDSS